jgi:hypothetical protein
MDSSLPNLSVKIGSIPRANEAGEDEDILTSKLLKVRISFGLFHEAKKIF